MGFDSIELAADFGDHFLYNFWVPVLFVGCRYDIQFKIINIFLDLLQILVKRNIERRTSLHRVLGLNLVVLGCSTTSIFCLLFG